MNDKPILFNTDMVLALLDGRKTMTRRIVNPQPPNGYGYPGLVTNASEPTYGFAGPGPHLFKVKNRYGQPGDLIWVRETTETDETTNNTCVLSRYTAGGDPVLYSSSGDPEHDGSMAHWDYHQSTRPNIHMPRWASRLTLKITSVRVERVQDVSEKDAIAEGIRAVDFYPDDGYPLSVGYTFLEKNDVPLHNFAYKAFKELWDSLNKKRGYGWDVNPWVWVIEFEVIKKNVDEVLKE